jgi:hypothetical protein
MNPVPNPAAPRQLAGERGKAGLGFSHGVSQEAPSIGPEHEEQGNDKDQANKCPDCATEQWRNHSLFTVFAGNAGHCHPERLPPETDGHGGDHDGGDMKAADRKAMAWCSARLGRRSRFRSPR